MHKESLTHAMPPWVVGIVTIPIVMVLHTQEKEYVPLTSASTITYSDTVFLYETLNGVLLSDFSSLIGSEIAGLYLRYVIVI